MSVLYSFRIQFREIQDLVILTQFTVYLKKYSITYISVEFSCDLYHERFKPPDKATNTAGTTHPRRDDAK